MKWRTEISTPQLPVKIDHSSSVVLLGSCFTDEIGERLRQQLFDVDVNPLGTLFNPFSIADAIEDALDMRSFTTDELFCVDGTWRSLRRHSRFALSDREDSLNLLNDSMVATRKRLLSANVLIVTFGSAIVHRHIPSGRIAANCHKLPADNFAVEPLTVVDITGRWKPLIERLHTLNPGLNILLTVSPVRHIGYGLSRDRLSKSTLLVAVNELLSSHVHYFPSYEIIVDDLRDYRWYADDMVHPSQQAVDYVCDLFRQSVMTPATISNADRWNKLSRRLLHRHSTPEAQDAFIADTLKLARELASGNNALYQRFTKIKYDI